VKGITRILSVLAVVLLAWGAAGCKKQASAQAPKRLEDGVLQLQAALAKASPEAQRSFYNEVDYGIRYDNYPQALAALGRIAADPSLNTHQKKLVNDVAELVKARMQGQAKPAP